MFDSKFDADLGGELEEFPEELSLTVRKISIQSDEMEGVNADT